MIRINKELNAKILFLVVDTLISGAFIKAIIDSIKNSIPIIKIWWLSIVPVFAIVDFITWLITGEEIIVWLLKEFGIELD